MRAESDSDWEVLERVAYAIIGERTPHAGAAHRCVRLEAAACRADLELMARAADGSSASPKRNAAWPGRKSQLKNRRKINQG